MSSTYLCFLHFIAPKRKAENILSLAQENAAVLNNVGRVP